MPKTKNNKSVPLAPKAGVAWTRYLFAHRWRKKNVKTVKINAAFYNTIKTPEEER